MARLIGLTAIFGILPIGEAISLWDGAIGGYFFSGVIAVIAYLCYGARFPSSNELRSQILVPLLLLAIWAMISLQWCPSDDLTESRRRIISLVLLAGQLHIIFDLIDTKRACVYVFTIYALVIACFIGGTIFGLTPWECISRDSHGRLTAGISEDQYLNENNVGNQASTAILFVAYLLSHYKHFLAKIATILLGSVAFVVLILAGSRGALVGLVAGFGAVAFFSRQEILNSRKNYMMLVFGALAAVFCFFLLDDVISNTAMAQRFLESNTLERGIYGRLEVIFGGIRSVFFEGNFLGSGGLGTFTYYSEHYRQEYVPHCMPIAMLADLGLIGLLLYFFVFWQVYKSIKRMPKGNEKKLCIALGVLMLATTSGDGGGYYAGWTWIMLGLITTIGYRMQSKATVSEMAMSKVSHNFIPSHADL